MRIVFKDCFEDLFDIAHAEVLSVITIDEDRQFLIAQGEKSWSGSMTSVDKVWGRKEKVRQENKGKSKSKKKNSLKIRPHAGKQTMRCVL